MIKEVYSNPVSRNKIEKAIRRHFDMTEVKLVGGAVVTLEFPNNVWIDIHFEASNKVGLHLHSIETAEQMEREIVNAIHACLAKGFEDIYIHANGGI